MANRSLDAKLAKSRQRGKFQRWAINAEPDTYSTAKKEAFCNEATLRLVTNHQIQRAPSYLPITEHVVRAIPVGYTVRKSLRQHF